MIEIESLEELNAFQRRLFYNLDPEYFVTYEGLFLRDRFLRDYSKNFVRNAMRSLRKVRLAIWGPIWDEILDRPRGSGHSVHPRGFFFWEENRRFFRERTSAFSDKEIEILSGLSPNSHISLLHSTPLNSRLLDALDSLIRKGLVEIKESRASLTPEGFSTRFFVVFSEF